MSSDLNDPTGVNHYVAPAATTTLVVDAVRVDEKPSNLWSDAWRDLRRRPVFWLSLLEVCCRPPWVACALRGPLALP